eukprot:GHVP01039474.1.p1 GENE.GHVP01039474.1~~GHVP01039474.1.p1  ORF type:complete len:116 (-),score=16.48 GHVP01039474.1:30-377(-)
MEAPNRKLKKKLPVRRPDRGTAMRDLNSASVGEPKTHLEMEASVESSETAYAESVENGSWVGERNFEMKSPKSPPKKKYTWKRHKPSDGGYRELFLISLLFTLTAASLFNSQRKF